MELERIVGLELGGSIDQHAGWVSTDLMLTGLSVAYIHHLLRVASGTIMAQRFGKKGGKDPEPGWILMPAGFGGPQEAERRLTNIPHKMSEILRRRTGGPRGPRAQDPFNRRCLIELVDRLKPTTRTACDGERYCANCVRPRGRMNARAISKVPFDVPRSRREGSWWTSYPASRPSSSTRSDRRRMLPRA